MDLIKHNLDGYLVFNSDEHLNEFVGDSDKRIKYLTKFDGSNATLFYTGNKKYFYTDSRYTLQAKQQLDDTFEIRNSLLEDINSIEKGRIGLNKKHISNSYYQLLREEINKEIKFIDIELVDRIWKNKPKRVSNKIFEYAEESIFFNKVVANPKVKKYLDEIDKITVEKENEPIKAVKGFLKNEDDAYLLTKLDDIAWLLSLRGCDIEYVPEFYSYAYIQKNKISLFLGDLEGEVDKNPYMFKTVDKNWILEKFKDENLEIHDYDKFYEFLGKVKESKVFLSPNVNQSIFEILESKVEITSFVSDTKSIKTKKQLKNTFMANFFDGVALTNLFGYLYYQKPDITELGVEKKLKELKKRNELFLMESFGTIAGSGNNSAIVHHKSSDKKIDYNNLLLIDSGSQYGIGTTDITRTIAFSTPTADQIKNYTLVLKGHLAAIIAIAPESYFSPVLDISARKYLWENYREYGHSTGHGVGYVLDVHEAPPNVSIKGAIKPQQMYSIEPGYYIEGKYGIRIENVVFSYMHNGMMKNFNMTPVPLQMDLVDKSLLNKELYQYLEEYNKMVKELLLDYVDEDGKKYILMNTRFYNIH